MLLCIAKALNVFIMNLIAYNLIMCGLCLTENGLCSKLLKDKLSIRKMLEQSPSSKRLLCRSATYKAQTFFG